VAAYFRAAHAPIIVRGVGRNGDESAKEDTNRMAAPAHLAAPTNASGAARSISLMAVYRGFVQIASRYMPLNTTG
jgi:hypothetical protein